MIQRKQGVYYGGVLKDTDAGVFVGWLRDDKDAELWRGQLRDSEQVALQDLVTEARYRKLNHLGKEGPAFHFLSSYTGIIEFTKQDGIGVNGMYQTVIGGKNLPILTQRMLIDVLVYAAQYFEALGAHPVEHIPSSEHLSMLRSRFGAWLDKFDFGDAIRSKSD
jgi:hypothetical protein